MDSIFLDEIPYIYKSDLGNYLSLMCNILALSSQHAI